MINVFVAVVLKNFEDTFERESEENQILTTHQRFLDVKIISVMMNFDKFLFR